MNITLKFVLSIVVISALALVLTYFSYTKIRPLIIETNYPEPIWATIHGTISVPEDEIDKEFKPSSVFIKLPTYNPRFICRGHTVDLANITWINKTSGLYSLTFNLPIPMDVYVTTDCTGCNNELVSINHGDNKRIDLRWDSRKCMESIEFNDNPLDITQSADRFLDGISVALDNRDFSSDEREMAKDSIQRGREFIASSKRETNFTTSLLYAYYSQWYAWNAQLRIDAFDLKHCASDIQEILNNRNNSLCYVPDYDSYQDFKNANSTDITRYFYEHAENFEDLESINVAINVLYNDRSNVNQKVADCNQAKLAMERTFEFQEQFCKIKESGVMFFKYFPLILWSIILVGIGILIGKWLYENKQKGRFHGRRFNK